MDRLADTLREALENLRLYDGEVTVVIPKGLPAASATALIDAAREYGREVIISPLMPKDTVGLMGKEMAHRMEDIDAIIS